MFEILTPRLRMRPWRQGDVGQRARIAALAADPEMMKYINAGNTWSDGDVDDFFTRQQANLEKIGVCIGSVEERAGGELIGIGGLQPLGSEGRVQAAWWIAPEVQGKGYATEIARAVIEHGFDGCGLEEVFAVAYPGNIASIRVMEKAGMACLGEFTANELEARYPQLKCMLYVARKQSRV